MATKKRRVPKKHRAGKTREQVEREDSGPRGWLTPVLESAYSKLVPRDQAPPPLKPGTSRVARAPAKPAPLASRLQPGRGDDVLRKVPRDFWERRLSEYKRRKVDAALAHPGARAVPLPGQPALPGANNWVPIGPAVAARGQAVGRPTIGGRVSGLAIAPGGARVYAATANGGVFRSDDNGRAWRSMMDGFDVDATTFASTSLACGAIAINPSNPDRVYVGTGEGDTDALFTLRLTNALPSYRGIGPIRSDDGGTTWVQEASSPSLAGFAFYQLAVDPAAPDNVVAATTIGLYQRTIGAGGPLWQRRRTGNHSSVVVTRTGSSTTFFAAAWGGGVYQSADGTTWTTVGTGFPAGVGRVALAVQPDNPNVLYAFVATTGGALQGVYRLDGTAGAWRSISGVPNVLQGSQGDYDLSIAVDPNNANRLYLGGDYYPTSPYPGNIQRCLVTASGSSYSMTATVIGTNAHADVHVLALEPGSSDRLWAGTDGGCYVDGDATGPGGFEGRNTGLSSLCTNYIGQSSTEPALVYCGLQDNGTTRYLGEELWHHVNSGDGGYCVVHPTDPYRALVYANGRVYRTTNGGFDYPNWIQVLAPPWAIMAEPLVGAPGSERVALGAGLRVYVSNDFGATWPATSSPTFTLPGTGSGIYSMVFATPTRLFIGTTDGRVFRADLASGTWTATRLDNVTAGPLGLAGLVSDIAVDWADAGRQSLYLAFGGNGDARHVWHFNGTMWQARSGTGTTGLIDVEHNAIVVDPANTAHVYVAADVGVWRSVDAGGTWAPLQNGLPDAPVFDLQIHAGARLLRASTHGRGLYEYRLDPPALGGVELYMRDTTLDTARGENTDGRNDLSTWPAVPVAHWRSPNIKVDVPTPAGYQTPTNQIDFLEFHEAIVDGSAGVATIDPPQIVHNRVYVLVHNRGPITAATVRVTAVVTNASTVLNPLPAGYTANVQAGTPLAGPDWTTLGVVTLTSLHPGFPQVAAFDLPSTALPLPASLPGQSHFCLVAFAHSDADVYTATERHVDPLTIAERKVAQKNLHIVQFVGTPPPPGTGTGTWARLDVTGSLVKEKGFINLAFDLRRFRGRLSLLLPKGLASLQVLAKQKGFAIRKNDRMAAAWHKSYSRIARRLCHEGKFSEADYQRLVKAVNLVKASPLLHVRSDRPGVVVLNRLPIAHGDRHTIFLRIDAPRGARIGQSWSFSVVQSDATTGRIQGGADYSIRINKPARR